jgi:hemoglobin
MAAKPINQSVFEFAGGEPAFFALAAAHHERCLQDPELNHPFSHGVNPQHVERLAAYWAEVFGGPARFSEAHGGHSAMLDIHAGTGAGEDYGPRFVACFMQAADDAGLPDDPAGPGTGASRSTPRPAACLPSKISGTLPVAEKPSALAGDIA